MARSASQSKNAPHEIARGRRGRPTAERIVAIDAAIKTAALDLFVAAGFEATSMDAIAAAAKVSKGTLYARYESKEPLFRAILEEQLENWSQRASERDHLMPEDLEGRLRYHARTIVTVHNWREFRRISTLLEASARTVPDLAREWDEMVTKRSIETLTRDMAKAGDPDIEWEFFAKLFHSAISGWYRNESSQRTLCDDEIIAFADKVIDVMLISIRNSGST